MTTPIIYDFKAIREAMVEKGLCDDDSEKLRQEQERASSIDRELVYPAGRWSKVDGYYRRIWQGDDNDPEALKWLGFDPGVEEPQVIGVLKTGSRVDFGMMQEIMRHVHEDILRVTGLLPEADDAE